MHQKQPIEVVTAALTDVGNLRKFNEDSVYISADGNLVIVCDGMGGHVAGGLASKIAVETIKDIYYNFKAVQVDSVVADVQENLLPSTRALVAAVRLANRRIFNMATKYEKLRGMGTTVVALSFDNQSASMVHVGDSRIFRISDGKILQLTVDHSWLNELIEDDEIEENEIDTFAQKNVITRALGTSPNIKIDVHCERYKKDDIYVLCTDGLHSSIAANEIETSFLKPETAFEQITKELIETAKKRDGTDNITLAVAKVKQASRKSKYAGASNTIQEEEEKISSKEDKLIQERYGNPILKVARAPRATSFNRRHIALAGFALVTAVMGFFLGSTLSSQKGTPATRRLPLDGANQVVLSQNSINRPTTNHQGAAKDGREHNSISPQVPPAEIEKSEVTQDAVMTFVFFNDMKDFQKAMLEQRAMVLGTWKPYFGKSSEAVPRDFSIFLIDSSHNVIYQKSGIALPQKPE